jgi:hypothetical protein
MPGLDRMDEGSKDLVHKFSRRTDSGQRTNGYAVISRIDESTGESRRFWVYYWGTREDEFSYLAPATPGSDPPPLPTWM